MYVLPIDRDEVEALFGELGFRYYPDGIGRIDNGNWRDDDGREIHGRAVPSLAGKLLLVADENDEKKLRGARNPAIRKTIERGNRKHEEFDEWVRRKPGWKKRNYHRKGWSRYYTPDATAPSGNTVELKPESPSGRRAAKKKTKLYREITGTRSKALFYAVDDETGPKVEKAAPRRGLEAKQRYSVSAKINQNPYLEFHRRRATGPGGYRIRVKRIRRKIFLP